MTTTTWTTRRRRRAVFFAAAAAAVAAPSFIIIILHGAEAAAAAAAVVIARSDCDLGSRLTFFLRFTKMTTQLHDEKHAMVPLRFAHTTIGERLK